MKILAVIPAKSISKRLPGKNLKLLNHKPIISYTIEVAINCRLFNNIFISTDSIEIKDIALSHGLKIPFLRPMELCDDHVRNIDVVRHILEELPEFKIQHDSIMLLQPTSPFRNEKDIKNAVLLFKENECNSVISVTEYNISPFHTFYINSNQLKPLWQKYYLKNETSTNTDKLYRPNGSIFLTKMEYFLQYNTFVSEDAVPYIMPRIRSVDIDEDVDYYFAEFLLKTNKLEYK